MTLKIPQEMSLWKNCRKILQRNLVFDRNHSMNVKFKKIKCHKIGKSRKINQIKNLKKHLYNEIKQIITKNNNKNKHQFKTHNNKDVKENIDYHKNKIIVIPKMTNVNLNMRWKMITDSN